MKTSIFLQLVAALDFIFLAICGIFIKPAWLYSLHIHLFGICRNLLLDLILFALIFVLLIVSIIFKNIEYNEANK